MNPPVFGAGDVTRTHDLLITNQLHYRLCYTSDLNIIPHNKAICNTFFEIFNTFICADSRDACPYK